MDQPSHIGQLVLGLVALATLTNLALQIFQRSAAQKRIIEPQPLEIRGAPQYAMAVDLQRLERDVKTLDTDLKSLRGEIVANGEVRRASIEAKVEAVRNQLTDEIGVMRHDLSGEIGGVHKRVDQVLAAVSELKGKVDSE